MTAGVSPCSINLSIVSRDERKRPVKRVLSAHIQLVMVMKVRYIQQAGTGQF
jgi:hypothetical protein